MNIDSSKDFKLKGMPVCMEIRRLSNLIRRFFEYSSARQKIDQATGNNSLIILYLAENSDREIYQKDIEVAFAVSRSTASKVLSLMEQKGLITRESVARDARLKRLRITDRARALTTAMQKEAQLMESMLMSGFSDEEQTQLIDYFRRMQENLAKISGRNEGDDQRPTHLQKKRRGRQPRI